MGVTEAPLGNQVQNVLGHALTARLTSDTNADIAIDLIGKY